MLSPIEVFLLIVWLVCGFAAGIIASKKGYRGFGYFAFGFLFGVFGILWAIAVKPQTPDGLRRVRCARCDAQQNVRETDPDYECWQCHARLRVME
jgi:hypothetical protein